jgi:hypothetical protein
MIINSKNNMTETIQDRIQAGNKAYYTNQMMLKNRYINRDAKMQIYKTGSDMWLCILDHEKRG